MYYKGIKSKISGKFFFFVRVHSFNNVYSLNTIMYSLLFFLVAIFPYSWYLNSRDLNGHREYSFFLIKCDKKKNKYKYLKISLE